MHFLGVSVRAHLESSTNEPCAVANRAFHCCQSYHSKSASNIKGLHVDQSKIAPKCKHLPKKQTKRCKKQQYERRRKFWYRCCDENINVVFFRLRRARSCALAPLSVVVVVVVDSDAVPPNYLLFSKTIVITLNVPKCFGFNLPLFFVRSIHSIQSSRSVSLCTLLFSL